jgi:hypothetical protein
MTMTPERLAEIRNADHEERFWHGSQHTEELLAALDEVTKERDELKRLVNEVETTPKNQLEHMLYDTLQERDQALARVKELEQEIEMVKSIPIGVTLKDIEILQGEKAELRSALQTAREALEGFLSWVQVDHYHIQKLRDALAKLKAVTDPNKTIDTQNGS